MNPKSYLSAVQRQGLHQEGLSENSIYMVESEAADEAGDEDAAWGWLARAELPAHSLLFLKRRHGAGFVRERGFRTDNADAAYGSGWLDRAEER